MESFLSTTNVSYWTIPVALVLGLVPRLYSGLIGPGRKYFDRQNPRKFMEKLEKVEGLDKQLRLRLQRAESCTANAFEGLPLLAAAVTAANSAHLPLLTTNVLSISYIISRAVYTWVYVVGQENRKLAPARTLVWTIGTGVLMTMFVKAGMQSY